jgi:hypothetical protein
MSKWDETDGGMHNSPCLFVLCSSSLAYLLQDENLCAWMVDSSLIRLMKGVYGSVKMEGKKGMRITVSVAQQE